MHIVFPVFAALASLPTLVSAVRLPVSPQTSLQGRQKAREVYQRRQANSAGILRRLKEGPRKRQPSQVVCTDTSGGSNKLTNGGFEQDELSPWIVSTTGPTAGFIVDNYGYNTGGDTRGFVVTGSPGTATLTQSIDVCAGSTYSFSFYSGVPENVGTTTNGACTIDASIGGTPRYTVKPCSSLQPCNLESNVGANSYEYRIDTATYTATTSGSVQVTFQYTCARDSTETTLLDQVSVKQVAWAFRCSKGQTITVWVANHLERRVVSPGLAPFWR